MLRILVLLFCGVVLVHADTITDIVGPVTPYCTNGGNNCPWSSYDLSEKAEIDLIFPASEAYPPVLGSALPGTYTLTTGSPITLVGTTSPGVSVGAQIVVAWNAADGTGTGRYWGTVAGVSGNTITFSAYNNAGLVVPPIVAASSPLSGLTVYACTRCNVDVVDPTYGTGLFVYQASFWGLNGQNAGLGWNFYDSAIAAYRMYLRTGDTTYRTYFRNMTDTWWSWALGSGAYEGFNPPRWWSLLSQYVRALDGQSQRFPVLYTEVKANYDGNCCPARLDGQDTREPGYVLMWTALGAKADPDATRHTSYCTMMTSLVNNALSVLSTSGLPYWPEKNGPYPYAMPGISPWRVFAINQGLARAYDVLSDATMGSCYDATLAASVLTAIQGSAAYIYNSGYDSTGRAIFYDSDHPNNGQVFTQVAHPGSGCTVTSGSANFTCPSAQLQTDFNCNGTDFISFETSGGASWVGKLASCSSQTAGTLTANWNGAMQTSTAYTGNFSAGTYTAIVTDVGTTRTLPATSSGCNSAASFCVSFITAGYASQQPGYENRVGNFDPIWIMGWLYKTTGATIWKTRGDELFSAAYGGPALGPQISPGACGGPGCDGYQAEYSNALTGCGSNSNVPPCNPYNNRPANINAYPGTDNGPKTLGQMSGIGGADNYLAWRLTGTAPSGSRISGSTRISAGARK